jgi:hypothetical protein
LKTIRTNNAVTGSGCAFKVAISACKADLASGLLGSLHLQGAKWVSKYSACAKWQKSFSSRALASRF